MLCKMHQIVSRCKAWMISNVLIKRLCCFVHFTHPKEPGPIFFLCKEDSTSHLKRVRYLIHFNIPSKSSQMPYPKILESLLKVDWNSLHTKSRTCHTKWLEFYIGDWILNCLLHLHIHKCMWMSYEMSECFPICKGQMLHCTCEMTKNATWTIETPTFIDSDPHF